MGGPKLEDDVDVSFALNLLTHTTLMMASASIGRILASTRLAISREVGGFRVAGKRGPR